MNPPNRTGLDFEARTLATLAEARLGAGDREEAQQAASEAIDLAAGRGAFFWEIFARLAAARALLELDGRVASNAVAEHLARARELIERAGAKALDPFVRIELAKLARRRGDEATHATELREAHRLFLEIGAPLRAAGVAKELAQ